MTHEQLESNNLYWNFFFQGTVMIWETFRKEIREQWETFRKEIREFSTYFRRIWGTVRSEGSFLFVPWHILETFKQAFPHAINWFD